MPFEQRQFLVYCSTSIHWSLSACEQVTSYYRYTLDAVLRCDFSVTPCYKQATPRSMLLRGILTHENEGSLA
jgi:hypothetical protein